MKIGRSDNTKKLTGLFFTILMFAFLFYSSYSFSNSIQKSGSNQLTIQSSPAAEIVFSNAETSSESIFQSVSKFETAEAILSIIASDAIPLKITSSDGLRITPSLFNTFYTHISAKAP